MNSSHVPTWSAARIVRAALVPAIVVFLGSLAFAVGQDAPAAVAPSDSPLPEGPGKALVLRVCGVCHDPTRAASVRLTADGWSQVLEDMVRRGAKATDVQRVLSES